MKLSLLEPNAHYDLSHGKPSVIERDNDGSVLYRFNIEEEFSAKTERADEEKQVGWRCREVRVFAKPTKAALKRAIIRSVLDETAEFALVNAYNAHVTKIKVDASAVAEYKEFLQFTEDVDAMLVSDEPNF